MCHLRVPWFQYPIIYDIRARPKRTSSPTGSKGKKFEPISELDPREPHHPLVVKARSLNLYQS